MTPSDGWVKEPQIRWGRPAPCGTARVLGSASPLTRLTLRIRSRFPPASLRFRDHDRLVHLRGGGRKVKQLVLAGRDLDEVFEVGASRRGRQCHGPDASATAFTPSRLLESPLVATEPYFDFTTWVIRSDIIVLLIGSRGLLVPTVPHLHHHAEHEPADVVAPLSILQGFVGAVVVDLWVQVGHRDAGGGSLDQRASGVRFAADHEGGKSLLWVAGVEVGLGELGRLQARAPPDYEGRIGGLRLAAGGLLTGRLNLHADVLEGGDGAWVEGGGSRPAAVEADLGHSVIGGGDVAHRRPEDATAAIARADDRDLERLPRLVVLDDPLNELRTGFPVRLVDHIEGCGQHVGVSGNPGVERLAGLGHVGFQALLHLGGIELSVVPGELGKGRWVHESLYSHGGEDALFAQSFG